MKWYHYASIPVGVCVFAAIAYLPRLATYLLPILACFLIAACAAVEAWEDD